MFLRAARFNSPEATCKTIRLFALIMRSALRWSSMLTSALLISDTLGADVMIKVPGDITSWAACPCIWRWFPALPHQLLHRWRLTGNPWGEDKKNALMIYFFTFLFKHFTNLRIMFCSLSALVWFLPYQQVSAESKFRPQSLSHNSEFDLQSEELTESFTFTSTRSQAAAFVKSHP